MKCANCLVREAKVVWEGYSMCGICFLDLLKGGYPKNNKTIKEVEETIKMWR